MRAMYLCTDTRDKTGRMSSGTIDLHQTTGSMITTQVRATTTRIQAGVVPSATSLVASLCILAGVMINRRRMTTHTHLHAGPDSELATTPTNPASAGFCFRGAAFLAFPPSTTVAALYETGCWRRSHSLPRILASRAVRVCASRGAIPRGVRDTAATRTSSRPLGYI